MSEKNVTTISEGLSFADILDLLWKFRLQVVLTVLLTATVSIVIGLLTTPIYKAEVTLSPVTHDDSLAGLSAMAGQFGGLASLAGINLGGGSDSALPLAVLKSRSFIEEFIEDTNLIPVLFDSKWDESAGVWRESDPSEVPTVRDAYLLFDKKIRRVVEDKRTGVVTLGIYWKDPEVASNWANSLVARLNDRLRNEAMQESEKSIAFLETELDALTYVGLRQGIHTLIENELRKKTLASVRKEYAYRIIDPAVPVDDDMFEYPSMPLIIAVGVILGIVLAIIIAILRGVSLRRDGRSAIV